MITAPALPSVAVRVGVLVGVALGEDVVVHVGLGESVWLAVGLGAVVRVAVELGLAVGLGVAKGTAVATCDDSRSGPRSKRAMSNSWPTRKIEVTLIPLASAIDSGVTP
ncbi:MAG TPA: hypothetical protein VMX14_01095 [Anaerolineae bacterium]|nr:hypothetical protein [Anaerolineae bacterium]